MPEKEILKQILEAYIADNACDESTNSVLQNFCDYANKWLADRGVVGIGHTPSGLALRFSDGQEIPLFVLPQREIATMPAVGITGTSGGSVRGAGAVSDNSVKITG